jgi:hypothetical protein
VLKGQAALSAEDVEANLADATARADDLQVGEFVKTLIRNRTPLILANATARADGLQVTVRTLLQQFIKGIHCCRCCWVYTEYVYSCKTICCLYFIPLLDSSAGELLLRHFAAVCVQAEILLHSCCVCAG